MGSIWGSPWNLRGTARLWGRQDPGHSLSNGAEKRKESRDNTYYFTKVIWVGIRLFLKGKLSCYFLQKRMVAGQAKIKDRYTS